MLAREGNTEATELADLFCREARQRIAVNFHRFFGKNDAALSKVAKHVLAGEHVWLEQGIVGMMTPSDVGPLTGPTTETRRDLAMSR